MAAKRGGNRQDGGQRDKREGAGRRQRQRVEKMVDGGTRGKGVGGMAAGWGVGTPALHESAPRSRACDWPRVAMVAGAAFTEIHRSH